MRNEHERRRDVSKISKLEDMHYCLKINVKLIEWYVPLFYIAYDYTFQRSCIRMVGKAKVAITTNKTLDIDCHCLQVSSMMTMSRPVCQLRLVFLLKNETKKGKKKNRMLNALN